MTQPDGTRPVILKIEQISQDETADMMEQDDGHVVVDVRRQDELLAGINHILEWNEGNHFQDADIRTAKAFLWTIKEMDN